MGSRNEVSAGGVVYRGEDDAIEIALAARRTRRGDLAWGLAKGAIEPGETEEQAAVREVLEETGLEVAVDGFVGAFSDRYGDGADDDVPTVLNLVFEARLVGGDAEAADDVTELAWFPRDALPAEAELAFRWIAPALREWATRARTGSDPVGLCPRGGPHKERL